MTNAKSFRDFFVEGPWAEFIESVRENQDRSYSVFKWSQRPGYYPDPPNSDLVIHLGLSPITGRVRNRLGGKPFDGFMRHRSMTLVPPGVPFELDCLANDDFPDALRHGFALSVDCSWITDNLNCTPAELAQSIESLQFDTLYDPAISTLIETLWSDLAAASDTLALARESAVMAIIRRLQALAHREDVPEHKTCPDRRIARVIEYIRDCLDNDLRLADMAAVACMSLHHFSRVFHERTGFTPHRFVMQRRCEKARDLLKDNDLSLAELALVCGFASQSHMTSAFRKEFGVTPAKFRADAL